MMRLSSIIAAALLNQRWIKEDSMLVRWNYSCILPIAHKMLALSNIVVKQNTTSLFNKQQYIFRPPP